MKYYSFHYSLDFSAFLMFNITYHYLIVTSQKGNT